MTIFLGNLLKCLFVGFFLSGETNKYTWPLDVLDLRK